MKLIIKSKEKAKPVKKSFDPANYERINRELSAARNPPRKKRMAPATIAWWEERDQQAQVMFDLLLEHLPEDTFDHFGALYLEQEGGADPTDRFAILMEVALYGFLDEYGNPEKVSE